MKQITKTVNNSFSDDSSTEAIFNKPLRPPPNDKEIDLKDSGFTVNLTYTPQSIKINIKSSYVLIYGTTKTKNKRRKVFINSELLKNVIDLFTLNEKYIFV